MKLWERVIENRLRRETTISENQFGFMPGRSTMEAIYLLRKLMERYREAKKDLHMIFIDLEKTYEKVPRNLIWWALQRKKVTSRYIELIQDMYRDATTMVRSTAGDTGAFPISVGLHQGSALSPYLFAIVVDELTKHVQEDVSWCMLFADDIVLVDETKEGVNGKLELWRDALESRGFRISRTKTEYMECNFSKIQHTQTQVVTIDGQQLAKSAHFR
ncbi:RNA-directed DNA polymerase, partial [Bartonella sp. AC326YNZD]|uniref:RNA-directed DNA polymerase n=1 Tax=Bartonella sp. AC326YNZD TaxID=3243451 RepID=UPI0035D10626